MTKIFTRFLGVAAVAGAAALAVASPAVADIGDEPAVVDHADGERRQITLHDVNKDKADTNGIVDLLREEVLHALSGVPNLGSSVSGPAGETQPGSAVMGEQGAEKIED
ncbi:hypothetical protein [Streptomyces sp. NPDC059533]|uniref:hypothetical protein n=1 Tax=unclassified Streptomyces TaxID=2593676 RepID=UPI00367D7C65